VGIFIRQANAALQLQRHHPIFFQFFFASKGLRHMAIAYAIVWIVLA